MIALVALLLVFGVVLGAVAHFPLSVSLIAAAVIGGWLVVFAVRERHGRGRLTERLNK
ncbi:MULTISPECIES: hypothetical protein [unclassified Streptomyces]|uniref:hypothetical protein n=1 Tax=unclassified Streptomyces TaxID=2593676 RepID=UPI002E14E126|nr:hypothetical protein OG452_09115 [Streptomyces sp. NBC_01197]WSS51836.1 hypothetical protein OG708_26275 [Streptomyces sp. NBC_01180]